MCRSTMSACCWHTGCRQVEAPRHGYLIVPDTDTTEQIAALPTEVLREFAEILSVLELTSWAGQPQNADNPERAVRRWTFGPAHAGQLVYLIDDRAREVHLLMVQWFGTLGDQP